MCSKKTVCVCVGTSLAVQCLRLCAAIGGVTGSIPGQETKILHAFRHGQKKKKKPHEDMSKVVVSIINKCKEIILFYSD